MKYLSGNIHSSIQRLFYFELNYDFNLIKCIEGKRYSDLSDTNDYAKYTDTLELNIGDVIAIRLFKHKDSNPYIYLEKVIKSNGEEIIYNIETLISKDFIEFNHIKGKFSIVWEGKKGKDQNKCLFLNIDQKIERDQKINSILK